VTSNATSAKQPLQPNHVRTLNFLKEGELNAMKQQNGPSGWVVTDEGRYKFLRIGDLRGRLVVAVGLNTANGLVPLEDIRRIDFKKPCCDITVELKDGTAETVNQVAISQITEGGSETFGIDGFPFVLVTADGSKAYTRRFPNFNGIKSIEIERGNAGLTPKQRQLITAAAERTYVQ